MGIFTYESRYLRQIALGTHPNGQPFSGPDWVAVSSLWVYHCPPRPAPRTPVVHPAWIHSFTKSTRPSWTPDLATFTLPYFSVTSGSPGTIFLLLLGDPRNPSA